MKNAKPAEPSPEVAPMQEKCKWCDKLIRLDMGGQYRLVGVGKHADMCDANPDFCFHEPAVPAVAPRETQTELKIPRDLQRDYEIAGEFPSTRLFLGYDVKKLIERIARLEGGR